ncbi:translation initiation factor IF-2-like isoform X2 [Grus americana]|uniref:translation initiation factor IF-2-like isoform X2 n=1 Tax=Grus americana TaxID=9117 RepID=UPI0024078D32|nr:translation initiation factor IF-2-like isoform X2 [Grus americana]
MAPCRKPPNPKPCPRTPRSEGVMLRERRCSGGRGGCGCCRQPGPAPRLGSAVLLPAPHGDGDASPCAPPALWQWAQPHPRLPKGSPRTGRLLRDPPGARRERGPRHGRGAPPGGEEPGEAAGPGRWAAAATVRLTARLRRGAAGQPQQARPRTRPLRPGPAGGRTGGTLRPAGTRGRPPSPPRSPGAAPPPLPARPRLSPRGSGPRPSAGREAPPACPRPSPARPGAAHKEPRPAPPLPAVGAALRGRRRQAPVTPGTMERSRDGRQTRVRPRTAAGQGLRFPRSSPNLSGHAAGGTPHLRAPAAGLRQHPATARPARKHICGCQTPSTRSGWSNALTGWLSMQRFFLPAQSFHPCLAAKRSLAWVKICKALTRNTDISKSENIRGKPSAFEIFPIYNTRV